VGAVGGRLDAPGGICGLARDKALSLHKPPGKGTQERRQPRANWQRPPGAGRDRDHATLRSQAQPAIHAVTRDPGHTAQDIFLRNRGIGHSWGVMILFESLDFGKMIKAILSNKPNQQTRANLPSFMNVGRISIGLFSLLLLVILVFLASCVALRDNYRTALDISQVEMQPTNKVEGAEVLGVSNNSTGPGRDAEPRTSTSTLDETYCCVKNPAALGIPLGPWGLNDAAQALWGEKYTGATIWTSPSKILALLDDAQTKGMHVVMSLSRFGKSDYQNPDGTFNLGFWKAMVDSYRGIDLDEYINDGTIILHYLVDEPKSRSNWGGQVITNDVLDEMARYSKEIWPNMLTAVRVTPVDLEKHAGGYLTPLPSWTWKYLDTAWLQYESDNGEINQYVTAQNESATRQRLGLAVGLQALTGGDGSSGISGPPGYTSDWAMSKDELLKYGTPLIKSPSSCAFLMWTYRYDLDPNDGYEYFNRPEIDASVATLKQLAGQRLWHSCKFGINSPYHDLYVPILMR
jgi:hypothetical protein